MEDDEANEYNECALNNNERYYTANAFPGWSEHTKVTICSAAILCVCVCVQRATSLDCFGVSFFFTFAAEHLVWENASLVSRVVLEHIYVCIWFAGLCVYDRISGQAAVMCGVKSLAIRNLFVWFGDMKCGGKLSHTAGGGVIDYDCGSPLSVYS